MMEEELFQITRKVLGEHPQWGEAVFSQRMVRLITPVSALMLLNLAGGVVSVPRTLLHGCWGMAHASHPSVTSPKSQAAFLLNHFLTASQGAKKDVINPGAPACWKPASQSWEVALPGSHNCCLMITKGISNHCLFLVLGGCCSLWETPWCSKCLALAAKPCVSWGKDSLGGLARSLCLRMPKCFTPSLCLVGLAQQKAHASRRGFWEMGRTAVVKLLPTSLLIQENEEPVSGKAKIA